MTSKNENLNLILVLEQLLRLRSVSAAAERLGRSQPSVSRSLARLRRHYGDELLVKQGRAMIPTPFAESLLQAATPALNAARQVLRARAEFNPQSATTTFRIAASEYAATVLAVPLAVAIRRAAPGCLLRIRPAGLASFDALVRSEVDLLLGPIPPRLSERAKRLVLRPLIQDHFVTVTMDGKPIKDLSDFLDRHHILVTPMGSDDRGAVDHALAALGRERRIAVTCPHFASAFAVLESSPDLVLTLPNRLAGPLRQHPRARVTSPPLDLSGLEPAAAWLPERRTEAAHTWLRARLMEVVQHGAGPISHF